MLISLALSFTVLAKLCCATDIYPFDDIAWLLAEPGESQAQTCSRYNMNPYPMNNYPFAWDISTMTAIVVDKLNMSVASGPAAPYGVKGCCAPGLWCELDDLSCFTQGFSERFSNYGWLSDNASALPVYSCIDIRNNQTAPVISTISRIISTGQITVKGNSFGYDAHDLTFSVSGETCNNVEMCNCMSCADTGHCPVGQDCGYYSNGKDAFCFPACAAPGDKSCPCGYECSSYGLCLPANLNAYPSQCASNSANMQCDVPRASQLQYFNEETTLVSIQVGDQAQPNFNTSLLYAGKSWCNDNADCYDGNVCTVDVCEFAGDDENNEKNGYCAYSAVDGDGCQSTPRAIQERLAPYMYNNYFISDRQAKHNAFIEQIRELGDTSSVSNEDDAPWQKVNLGFWMLYFGTFVNKADISPNGIIQFPPFSDCKKSTDCVPFSTQTNVVAPLSADWDPSASKDAQVWYYRQQKGDGSNIYGINCSALHILYSNVSLWQKSDGPSSFATSIYEDGSIRHSYINLNSTMLPLNFYDFSGLWGAFASESPSFLRYHIENASAADNAAYVESGYDVVYCGLNASVCVPESCVAAANSVLINWNGTNTCAALGGYDNTTVNPAELSYSCVWMGGVASTAATYANGTLECDVPVLDDGLVADGTTILLELLVSSPAGIPGMVADGNQDAVGNYPGTKSFYAVNMREGNGEITRTSVMVKYYSSVGALPDGGCGCGGLYDSTIGASQCDNVGVCGGHDNASTVDCYGTLFGSAYIDCNGDCVAGYTQNIPNFCTEETPPEKVDIISQLIVLLMIICCMTFITSTVTFSVRRAMALRAMQDQQQHEFDLLAVMNQGGLGRQGLRAERLRGLSAFECDALGETVFTAKFFAEHQKATHGGGSAEVAVAGDIGGGTVATAVTSTSSSSSSSEGGDAGGINTTVSAPESVDCPICLCEIEENSMCRVLPSPCDHIFHTACIDEWFKQSAKCPMCKRSIRAILEGDDDENEVSSDNTSGVGRVLGGGSDAFTQWRIVRRNRTDVNQQMDMDGAMRLDNMIAMLRAAGVVQISSTNGRIRGSGGGGGAGRGGASGDDDGDFELNMTHSIAYRQRQRQRRQEQYDEIQRARAAAQSGAVEAPPPPAAESSSSGSGSDVTIGTEDSPNGGGTRALLSSSSSNNNNNNTNSGGNSSGTGTGAAEDEYFV